MSFRLLRSEPLELELVAFAAEPLPLYLRRAAELRAVRRRRARAALWAVVYLLAAAAGVALVRP